MMFTQIRTFNQVGHKQMTPLIKMANDVYSIKTFNQVGHKQMTPLIKMANEVLVKLNI